MFQRVLGGWDAGTKLVAGGGWSGDYFGHSVCFDSQTVLVGAPRVGRGPGAAYAYRRTGSTWAQIAQFKSWDPYEPDRFGCSVGLDGEAVFVGAHLADAGLVDSGAAYVFLLSQGLGCGGEEIDCNRNGVPDVCDLASGLSQDSDGNGVLDECERSTCLLAKLVPGDVTQIDHVGTTVAVDGRVAVLGSIDNGPDAGGTMGPGAVYVYRFDGSSWVEEQKLQPLTEASGFGRYCLSVCGNTIAVGAPRDLWVGEGYHPAGSVYVFRYDGASWKLQQRFSAPIPGGGDQFGAAVRIQGDVLIVGSPGWNPNGGDEVQGGRAFVYRHIGGVWVLDQNLTPLGLELGDNYGDCVDLDGDFAAIGAGGYRGAVSVYRYNGTIWEGETLFPSDPEKVQGFGKIVAISGSQLFVGSDHHDDAIEDGGAVYVFCYDGSHWVESQRLFSDVTGYYFGRDLAVDC